MEIAIAIGKALGLLLACAVFSKVLLAIIEEAERVKRERALADEHRELLGELRDLNAEAAADDGLAWARHVAEDVQ